MAVRKRRWTTAKGETKHSWVAEYSDQGGKRRIETFGKKKDADARLAAIKVDVGRGLHTPEQLSRTVNEAADLWLAACDANGLERTSVNSYKQHMDLHVRPFLGLKKLTQLTVPVIREFEDRLRSGNPVQDEAFGRPRSPDMVRRVVRSLGTMLADAQDRGLVSQNVVRGLRASRGRDKARARDRRQRGKLKIGIDIPAPVEIKAMVTTAQGRWRPVLLTAIFTGLRSSELRGLRWQDVDLEGRQLHVRQRADNRGNMGAPKSETSARTVPIPPLVLSTLRELRERHPARKPGLVFGTATGNPTNHSNIVQRGLQAVQIAAGIVTPKLDDAGQPELDEVGEPIMMAKYPGLHSLRHFYASWCINRVADGGLGLPPKVVQERLGHSTIVLTMDR